MIIFTRAFWAFAGERAIKTAAQTLIALIGTELVGITAIDWLGNLGVVATATVLSILTAVVTIDSTDIKSTYVPKHAKKEED